MADQGGAGDAQGVEEATIQSARASTLVSGTPPLRYVAGQVGGDDRAAVMGEPAALQAPARMILLGAVDEHHGPARRRGRRGEVLPPVCDAGRVAIDGDFHGQALAAA